jgi:3-methylcrotonyl-CoA carboxylase alpha subunit
MTFSSLLIANRGEIACRIIRTAKDLGLRTIAVCSDADREALHVRQADAAEHIGPSPAKDSYLDGARILAAAKASGADAIHPGYGFLSENADFAESVIAAGLVWVGPDPASIRAMGLKDASKKLMAEAGVPVTPGYLGEDQSVERLAREADAIGYPVLIKAVAGGGGKGMRRVDAPTDFADALASCQREAAASFGDDRVLLEKYIACPRHLEVQIFGDKHGNIVHLFERDCSLQRRHQKVIEEAPAPDIDQAAQQALYDAAVRAAAAVNYVGAGTIEFIADASERLSPDRIWFMEMNTRLQVEHPVTEEITGVDLVEWQLRVAAGEPLPLPQDEITAQGWAMEARLYAEDPVRGFLPSTGRLDLFQTGYGGRVDTGVEEGGEISPYYDPMIAKLIARGDHREEAREQLLDMVRETAVWPVKTNAAFLARLLEQEDFVRGQPDTGLIERYVDDLTAPPVPSAGALTRAAMAMVPRSLFAGFRLNAPEKRSARFLLDGAPVAVQLHGPGEEKPAPQMLVAENGAVWRLEPWRATGKAGSTAGDGAILAPMPGRVLSVEVAAGQTVTRGQKLLTLEAMKMEHSLVAPFNGTVEDLMVSAGAQVQVDALLVKVVAAD